ncbi:MAG TPA: PepSY domain-containing protein [Methylophilaceae bacterium]
MKKNILLVALFSLAAIPVTHADTHDALGACVKAAQKLYPGKITSVRGEIEDGKVQYELDIDGNDGKQWEVECDAKTGKVLETEGETTGNDPAFISKAKVSLADAVKAALAKYPGTISKIEYEIESDGVAYEFDILTKDGRVLEVEVNAITGEIDDPEEVLYEIGG